MKRLDVCELWQKGKKLRTKTKGRVIALSPFFLKKAGANQRIRATGALGINEALCLWLS
jgi:hypothetical protein